MNKRCTCDHVEDEHDGEQDYPGSTSCNLCDCIAFEESEQDEDTDG